MPAQTIATSNVMAPDILMRLRISGSPQAVKPDPGYYQIFTSVLPAR